MAHAQKLDFSLSAKRTSPFKSPGASVQSTTGNGGVRISGSNAGNTMFRGSVKSTGYPLHLPVFPSLPLQCVTVCHHISTGVYLKTALASSDTSKRKFCVGQFMCLNIFGRVLVYDTEGTAILRHDYTTEAAYGT
jgi:hypothetical protein